MKTPKFKSAEFREALSRLKETFDFQALGILLGDAMERRSAEEIVARFDRAPGGARLSGKPKTELCGKITGWFFSSDEVAYQVVRELDRACDKEGHLVASIPEGEAESRVGSYKALALKRERAKLVWALARDERVAVRALARKVIREFLEEVADVEMARGRKEHDELASKLLAQHERVAESDKTLAQLIEEVARLEGERARFLVTVGSKERALVAESEARARAEAEADRLRAEVVELSRFRAAPAPAALEEVGELRAERDALASRIRRLSKKAEAAHSAEDLSRDLDALRRAADVADRFRERERQEAEERAAELERRLAAAAEETRGLRDELRAARRRLAEAPSADAGPPPDVAGPAATTPLAPASDRVGIFVDVANLAGAAQKLYGEKVDFVALLARLAGGRTVAVASAYAVDMGGANFEGFSAALRRAGYRVKVKKPRFFADGTVKADWDMGIAMDIVDAVPRLDVVVLASGDGDFTPLVRRLQRWGKRVEVASYAGSTHPELPEIADRFLALGRGEAGG